jgi:beta-mannosidase
MTAHALDGIWRFRLCGRPRGVVPPGLDLERWRDAVMPGTIHHALQRHGLIPDAFVGRNEMAVQWVDEQDWELRRTVRLQAKDVACGRQELVFEGLDTVAGVTVNGRRAGTSRNMFREVVLDVRGLLKAGSNEVRVVLGSPTRHTRARARASRVRYPRMATHFEWQTGESREVNRHWIRKAQCHFGWDWGPCLPTSGIWLPARIECSDLPRIASLHVLQEHAGPAGAPSSVDLTLTVRLESPSDREGVLTVEVDGGSVTTLGRLRRGGNAWKVPVRIGKPRLWWPAGQGDQPLYEVRVLWKDASGATEPFVRRLGLRTVELVRERDRTRGGAPGESFFFRVNGRPVFMKGADWIPPDAYEDRATPGVVRHLLSSMVEANMNAVRVWGGGRYERESFYDLCDELGLLVWQDFMMACAAYPDERSLMREYEEEARYQVRRLQHRACLALWCGDNENLSGLQHWWNRLPDFPRLRRAYRRVMGLFGRVARREDPTRAFWVSSPSNGSLAGETDDPDRGDVHYWKVWHGRRPFEDYLTVRPRFVSEFGFQSFPEADTLARVLPPGERNASSHAMEHHQRSPDGNAIITNTMMRETPVPSGFASFCRMSQLNQALAIRTAVEHWRRCKPWCMGTVVWQLNDNWPVASWSSIDWSGRWKALHHEIGRAFAPLLLSLVRKGETLEAWVTSDVPRPLSLQGTLDVLAFDGRRVGSRPLRVRLPAGACRRVASFRTDSLAGGRALEDLCVFAELAGDGLRASNHLNLAKWKWARLRPPRLSVRLEAGPQGPVLVVRAGNVVPFLHARLEGHEGHFAGDGTVLRPGRTWRWPWVAHVERGAAMPTLRQARRALRVSSLWDLSEHPGA